MKPVPQTTRAARSPRVPRPRVPLLAALLAASVAAAACASEPPDTGERAPDSSDRAGVIAGGVPLGDTTHLAQDRAIFERIMRDARTQRLDTVRLGAVIDQLARGFVGAPYVPATLEPPGPERLVINLREFDCVTLVENVLALARIIVRGQYDFDTFAAELLHIRYRRGVLAGYPSRLHYFSEWIRDNTDKGVVRDITRELGGALDGERIDFMSAHADAYRQLADDSIRDAIGAIEQRLNQQPRYVLAESRIAGAEAQIQPGDVIAATAAQPGLDVAHTGFAVRIGGRIHLLHAPLVGDSVQISPEPLADRIVRIASQDGIMVARPVEAMPARR